MPFDPNAFEQYKAQQAPAGGFDPNAFAAYKAQAEPPSLLQKAAQLSAMPRNALRGVDTGIESLIQGKGLKQAEIDSIAATLPGYQAQDGSKLAEFAANAQDPRMLATMAIPGLGAAGSTLAKVSTPLIQGAVAGAAGSALPDLENTGTTSAGSVLGGAALGLGTAGGLQGLGYAASKAPEALNALTGFGKRAYTASALLRPGTLPGYETNRAAVKGAQGTLESQLQSAKALQDAITSRMDELRQPIQEAKQALGVPPSPEIDLDTLKANANDALSRPIPNPAQSPVNFPQPEAAPYRGPTLALPPAGGFTPEMNTIGPTQVIHTPEGFSYYRYRQVEPEFAASAPETQQSKFRPSLPESFQRPAGQLDGTIPTPAAPETNLDRVRELAVLKDQLDGIKRNMFKASPGAMGPITNNDPAADLRSLYGQLNAQMKVIPEAAPLNAANEAYSPARKAFDQVLQPQFGKGPDEGKAASNIYNIVGADPTTPGELSAPGVKRAIDTVGGEVPAAYNKAAGEAIKREMKTPVSSATRNVAKMIGSAPFRATWAPAINTINGANNYVAQPLAQALSATAGFAKPAIPSLIEALMANSKQHQ